MKVLVGTFNQEKALVGAFSVIVKPMDRFTALIQTLQSMDGSLSCFAWCRDGVWGTDVVPGSSPYNKIFDTYLNMFYGH